MKKMKLLKTLGVGTLAFGACAVMSLSVVMPALFASASDVKTTVRFVSGSQNSEPMSQKPEQFSLEFDDNSKITATDDETIFTTSYGLDIHVSNTPSSTDAFPKFSAGGHNWWIIGYGGFAPENTTPAGAAITADGANECIYSSFISNYFPGTSGITCNAEIPPGCVLCLCEDLIKIEDVESTYQTGTYWYTTLAGSYRIYFDYNPTYSHNKYGDSDCELKKVVDSYYRNKLQGTTVGNKIQKVTTLNTFCYDSSSGYGVINMASTAGDTYLFPLAYGQTGYTLAESFCVGTYMDTNALRIAYPTGTTGDAYYWWLRSGSTNTSNISLAGNDGILGHTRINVAMGARPAFILKLV